MRQEHNIPMAWENNMDIIALLRFIHESGQKMMQSFPRIGLPIITAAERGGINVRVQKFVRGEVTGRIMQPACL